MMIQTLIDYCLLDERLKFVVLSRNIIRILKYMGQFLSSIILQTSHVGLGSVLERGALLPSHFSAFKDLKCSFEIHI
jgi:hypothetical protein